MRKVYPIHNIFIMLIMYPCLYSQEHTQNIHTHKHTQELQEHGIPYIGGESWKEPLLDSAGV